MVSIKLFPLSLHALSTLSSIVTQLGIRDSMCQMSLRFIVFHGAVRVVEGVATMMSVVVVPGLQ